jgi:hypothetical protein
MDTKRKKGAKAYHHCMDFDSGDITPLWHTFDEEALVALSICCARSFAIRLAWSDEFALKEARIFSWS